MADVQPESGKEGKRSGQAGLDPLCGLRCISVLPGRDGEFVASALNAGANPNGGHTSASGMETDKMVRTSLLTLAFS